MEVWRCLNTLIMWLNLRITITGRQSTYTCMLDQTILGIPTVQLQDKPAKILTPCLTLYLPSKYFLCYPLSLLFHSGLYVDACLTFWYSLHILSNKSGTRIKKLLTVITKSFLVEKYCAMSSLNKWSIGSAQ